VERLAPETLGIQVGDIFVARWWGTRLNADFYQVTGLTPAGVRVRKIRSERISVENPPDAVDQPWWGFVDEMPIPGEWASTRDEYGGRGEFHRLQWAYDKLSVPCFHTYGGHEAVRWDGKPTRTDIFD
jgi:hypothetical protein